MHNFIKYTSIIFLLVISLLSYAQKNYEIRDIHIEGNKKTKEYIVLRELTFQKGDELSLESLNQKILESEENLVNTSLFHFADMSIENIDSTSLTINIQLTERWYLWPIPEADIDERNFNAWWEHKRLDRISAGVYVTQNNSRGRMETWQLTMIAGHNQQFGFAYEFPYINSKKTLGLGLSTLYSARHEVNISTVDNKQVFLKLQDEYAQQSLTNSVWLTHRPNIYFSQLLSLNHKHYSFSDSVLLQSKEFTFNGLKQLDFLSLYYKLKLDHRNYKSYPLKGYYADLELQQDGLGLLDLNKSGFFTAKTTIRKYWAHSSRWYSAIGFMGKVSTQQSKPYMLQRALGYNRDFVRGYEYYVIDGHSFALAKANVKFALIPQNKFKLNFIPTEKFNTIPYAFYLNVYGDVGYVNSTPSLNTNSLQNAWLTGYGIGLDFVTYYDWVVRMEVSTNKMKETGFYLHFIAPI